MSGLFQDDPPTEDLPPPPDGPGLFGDALPTPPPEAAGAGLPGIPAAPVAPAPVAPTPAYRVLARKYRPTRFDDLIGQEAMVRTLRNAFAMNRVAHAFMLTGVRGVGKTTTARIIARALNCVGPDGTGGPTADPCGVCANCTAILADRHPDVMEMDAASRTGVDDVREIIEGTRYRPIQARAKVFVIDEVHMLTRNAFNALLKTLEEPPPHVKFVFATTEIRKVPITVLSRCQRFDLRRVRVNELAQHFAGIAAQEGMAIEQPALDQIARAADGSVRDGLSLLDQAIAQAEGTITAAQVSDMLGLADRDAVFDLLEAVLGGNPAAALAATDRAYERGADLGVMLQDLLELVHTLTRLKSVPALRDSHELPEAERTRGAALAEQLSVPALARAWQMLLKGVGEVESAPDRRAAAEMVLIRLCHVGDLPPPAELVRRLAAAPASGGTGRAAPGGSGGSGSGGAGGAGSATAGSTTHEGDAPAAGEHGGATAAGNAGFAAGASLPVAAQTSATQTSATQTAALQTPAPRNPAPRNPAPRNPASQSPPPPHIAVAIAGGRTGSGRAGHAAAFAASAVATEQAVPAESPPEPDPSLAVPFEAPPTPPPAPPRFTGFRDVAAFVAEQRQAMLHAHLLHSVHLVRFAPPVIELRPQPVAPRDLAPRLATLLTEATGTRWTIALSTAAGEPTLADQGNAADAARRASAADHPLVRAILDAFPGARIDSVRDATADAYGLPAEPVLNADDADIPEFAPPDAEFSEEMEPDA
jgi:DNA polymerase-3 subunit gamma/tau